MDNVFTVAEVIPYSGVYRIAQYPPHTGEEALALKRKHISAVRPLFARILHADQAGVSLRH